MAEVYDLNHIAEACVELALYRVMISIDYFLHHYTTGPALAAMETELWLFTEFAGIRVFMKEAERNRPPTSATTACKYPFSSQNPKSISN